MFEPFFKFMKWESIKQGWFYVQIRLLFTLIGFKTGFDYLVNFTSLEMHISGYSIIIGSIYASFGILFLIIALIKGVYN